MSTTAQIKANQENAKLSTGPVNTARSSQNAVKHGLTGQTLVLTPEEAESYSEHVTQYMAHYEPADHYQHQLVQDLADSDWGVHQIFLLQSATVSYMQKLSRRLAEAVDAEAEAAILAADKIAVRKLATLNSYENRKRRASKLIREQINEIAMQEAAEAAAKSKQTKPDPEIGFVNPNASDPEPPASQPEALQAWLRRQTAKMTVEEALKFAKSRR